MFHLKQFLLYLKIVISIRNTDVISLIRNFKNKNIHYLKFLSLFRIKIFKSGIDLDINHRIINHHTRVHKTRVYKNIFNRYLSPFTFIQIDSHPKISDNRRLKIPIFYH